MKTEAKMAELSSSSMTVFYKQQYACCAWVFWARYSSDIGYMVTIGFPQL